MQPTQVKNIQREEFRGRAADGGEVRIEQVASFELEALIVRTFLFLQVVAAFSLLKKNLRIDQLTGHRLIQIPFLVACFFKRPTDRIQVETNSPFTFG